MDFLGARVHLNPRPQQTREAALEVAMLGHCPGRVRFERLMALPGVDREIRLAGFGDRLDQCLAARENLHHLPLPLHSLAEFEDIFPGARSAATQFQSRLAGGSAWLPKAVDDFFANGGEKLWLVQIPENEGVNGFLPTLNTPLHDTENLFGLATVLVLNRVGLVALPDLERIQIPANLKDIPRVRLANPDPQFIPCTQSQEDDHRERRRTAEIPDSDEPTQFLRVVQRMLELVYRHRPDIQCLLSMPLAYSDTLDSPQIDHASVADLNNARSRHGAYLLRQAQFLFPYLRSEQYDLFSPVGVVAGALAHSARRRGIWRSIAWQALLTDGSPYPLVNQVQGLQLREDPGIGVIQKRQGKVQLDDERIVVPALHRGDYNVGGTGNDELSEALKALRSAEVVRFLGYLVRQLRSLGETLIFNVDYRDPRPRLLLEKYFHRLFELGALRGSRPDQAYTITQRYPQEGVIAMDIAIAPAFPIDKISLTFINRDGSWLTEANYG